MASGIKSELLISVMVCYMWNDKLELLDGIKLEEYKCSDVAKYIM